MGANRVTKKIEELSRQSLDAYRANPVLVDEHANLERALNEGTYGRRQLYELIQNAADAMLGEHAGGTIHVRLTSEHLYCANEGAPIDDEGITALLHAYLSVKRRDEIGRFGLGFKSVLGVTNSPEFHSTAGSFKFDAEMAASQIREIVPTAQAYPTLRVATPVDSKQMAASDPNLKELLTWATTVIRLPLIPDRASWLPHDLKEFPGEFLIFCDHVGSLILEDVTSDTQRVLTIKRKDSQLLLHSGEEESAWRLFSTTHKPSAEAKKEAGALANRDRIPVHWAVSVSGTPGTGKFWAFFPLSDETTVSGILNAPWKTNDDRTNLLPGTFNEELMEVAADLIVNHLPETAIKSDPGRALDVMPSRPREYLGYADQELTNFVYQFAAGRPSIPDQEGVFQRPEDLQLHPEHVPTDVLSLWSEQKTRPIDWVHPSIESRNRRARVNRLFHSVNRPASPLNTWLIALMGDPEDALSLKPCITVAARLAMSVKGDATTKGLRTLAENIRHCMILTDADGKSCDPRAIFLPGPHIVDGSTIPLVHAKLSGDPEVVESLTILGIQPVTPAREVEALIRQGFYQWTISDWDRFWAVVRAIGEVSEAAAILKNKEVHVRTEHGSFRALQHTLLPGPVVPADGTRDKSVAVDTRFHRDDIELLSALGVVQAPRADYDQEGERYRSYRDEQRNTYVQNLSRPGLPHLELLGFNNKSYTGPLEPFADLSEQGQIAFTQALAGQERLLTKWEIHHKTQGQRYPPAECASPELWAIRRWGVFRTSLGPRKAAKCVGETLKKWSKFLPVADECDSAVATALGIPTMLDALSDERWTEAFAQPNNGADDETMGRFYGAACELVTSPPSEILCRVGTRHAHNLVSGITVVASRREFDVLCREKRPVIVVDEKPTAAALVEKWGLKPASESVQTTVFHVAMSNAVLVVDQFPAVIFHLPADQVTEIELVECSEIRQETVTENGKDSRPSLFIREDHRIYWDTTLGVSALLERLDEEFNLDLGPETWDKILSEHANQQHRQRLSEIHAKPTDGERLLAALGATRLRRQIPAGLIRAVETEHGDLRDDKIAELALTVYGTDTLHQYKHELQNADLKPPESWAGSARARAFVRELGFAQAFAGYRQAGRDPLLVVDGPTNLPKLHDYQETIVDGIRDLVLSEPTDPRALLSLPTGAGKTRVAVEAIVRLFHDNKLRGPVLWVADRDELCEQAVESWRDVWRAIGKTSDQLHVSRLWAGNKVEPIGGKSQVVVATIAKLDYCRENSTYDWLQHSSLVVIDEAHAATTPSYTKFLRWQGIDRTQTRCPLIGLTATPFRGRSQEETERLVNRFSRRRLDQLGDNPYQALQAKGILATVEHRTLVGVIVTLDPVEEKKFQQLHNVPSSVLDRVGKNPDRNRTLLQSVQELPPEWPILMFTASVEHAQTMAALLKIAGTTAAPITADTAPAVRRSRIEDFRNGRVQVLTNYGVLTQGFDAPAVRAIYVARPVFSPNVYQQIIGRGLRGPKNGGKDVCLIVNVEDTVEQFGENLAFREFEHLWTSRKD